MNVLVDTSVWSLALRRKPSNLNPSEQKIVSSLSELIQEGRVVMIGAIRQEILSGLKEDSVFEKLAGVLRAFPDEKINSSDHEEAARCYNRCRSKGIAASAIDMLICAVALRRSSGIFTTDPDFNYYAKYLSVVLYK
jgi:predicted nucleic acid-binding protein